jgi:hypothetical protein
MFRKLVGKCHQCNSRKGPHEKVRLPERKYLTSEAFERIAVDICGRLPETKNHNKYMLVVTDYFSKWVEPLAIKNQETETVASALINEFIARYGCPTSIYSDRGAQFTSRLVKIICDRLHIQKVNTCPYRPSSNGQCERSNRSLIDALSKVIQNEKEWDELLPLVGMYYRASTHRATGVSPALLALWTRSPITSGCNVPDRTCGESIDARISRKNGRSDDDRSRICSPPYGNGLAVSSEQSKILE